MRKEEPSGSIVFDTGALIEIISGSKLGAYATVVQGASVTLTDSTSKSASTSTDNYGFFEFGGLTRFAVPCKIQIQMSGYTSTTVSAASNDIDL